MSHTPRGQSRPITIKRPPANSAEIGEGSIHANPQRSPGSPRSRRSRSNEYSRNSNRSLQVKAAVFVPKGSTTSVTVPANVNAPIFTPQNQRPYTPESRPFTPEIAAPLMRDEFLHVNDMSQPQSMLNDLQQFTGPSHNMLHFDAFPPDQDVYHPMDRMNGHESRFHRMPIYYHLYQGPMPHMTNMTPQQAAMTSFFVSPSLREDLQKRAECLLPSNEGTEIPGFFSIVPLDTPTMPANSKDTPNKQVQQSGLGIFGIRNWLYKTFSEKDGKAYVLRRFEGYKLNSKNEGAMIAYIEKWRKLRHPNLVSVHEAFTTKAFGDSSLIFVFDYHPLAATLYDVHLSVTSHPRHHVIPVIPEHTLWSYIIQLSNVVKLVHANSLAVRTLELSKIIVTGKDRLRVNCCAVLDILRYDQPVSADALRNLQQEDLFDLGKVILSLACHSPGAIHNLQKSIEYVSRTYSQDFQQLCLFLFSKPHSRKTIDEVLNLVGSWRLLEELNASVWQSDTLESEMLRELENGRLVRLLCKFGFINERPEFDHDPRWAESGDRYLVKLFRDHIFHQVSPEDGRPVVDLSYVLLELNKLDAGSEDKLTLMSRDGQNCLVVTYREVRNCIDAAYKDLSKR